MADKRKMLVVGICGGSGSGKSTVSEMLKKTFGDDAAIMRHDDYYKRQDGRSYEERAKQNYDHPDAFDTDLMVEHLKALIAGESVSIPEYDYTVHNRSDGTHLLCPVKVLIIDGLLILSDDRLRELMDIRVFVDTDADIRILRRIMRDVTERQRSLQSVINQYMTTVKPMHEMFVEPSRRFADIIVPEGGYNAVAVEILTARIREHIEKSS